MSDKRGSGQRPKKRKFRGNKHTCKTVNSGKSASSKKLSTSNIMDDSTICTKQFDGYRLVDIAILFEAIEKCVSCKICGADISIIEESRLGLCSKFAVCCSHCKELTTVRSCQMVGEKKNIPEINRRSVYAMRCVGLGLSGLRTFCYVMDLPPPVSQNSFDIIMSRIAIASKDVAERSMRTAGAEEIAAASSPNLCVSGDGTWKTRGHCSQIGVCSVIGSETGKVLDVEVLSSFCKSCSSWKGPKNGVEFQKWWNEHEPQCKKNHSGSSGKMEVAGITAIFLRSKAKHSALYTQYVGDGDTQTYANLVKLQPYGPGVTVEKIECVGHVQKRMGTRLRKLKSAMAGKKLSDGKTLSGKGRLTDNHIEKLARYYGNAIREGKDDLAKMRELVWAVFFHRSSTDNNPSHSFCPKGETSWCKFQEAKATGCDLPKNVHKNSLPAAVMDCIKPIFKDLSSTQLLRRCLGGKTQNPNESFNGLLWTFCPKTSSCGKRTVDVAAYETVVQFNDGQKGRINIMKELDLCPGKYALAGAVLSNTTRLRNAEKRAAASSLEARKMKRRQEYLQEEQMLAAEGVSYEAGSF